MDQEKVNEFLQSPIFLTAIAPIILAIIGAIGVTVRNNIERRRLYSESADFLVNSATGLVAKLNERIDDLEERVEKMERDLADRDRGIRILTQQVIELGDVPRYPIVK